ncbi:histidine phosphatase family protein [Lacticaseibacillus paracasei]|uniref:Phosphoglycerate mutase n=1 Tax=Lacticaseibacillus paracasei NRIC 0644 TaxID=1435038 RepID=A0A0C9PUJ2_LACPA|nr:histidine phosphatase family protein [Lacticaseibacillus paracasei]MXI84412.1 histidine phosphatase family protein [Lacticaseibacillus paracasei]URW91770.1 histidine phosphatase family protein [Lacticaseibacillus paracasei]GAN35679.1 hypothetical protein LC0644_0268 [Lacticaseibacillus paracasei NRIC 0644]GAN38200.1 hypothetical protein LC1917_0077 [Lacticaseibacillus paracasei NRIC 1917]
MTTNLYLVRHGQTIFNNERRVQGSADSGLTDKAVKDTVKLGQWFSKNNIIFDAIFSSDLPRAIHSAKLILHQQSNFKEKTLLDCSDLRELNYGHYEGWHVDSYAKTVFGQPNYNAVISGLKMSLADVADTTFETDRRYGGLYAERSQDVTTRIDRALRGIGQEAIERSWGNTLIVIHGTSILMWLESIGFNTHHQDLLHNLSVTKISFDGHSFDIQSFDRT